LELPRVLPNPLKAGLGASEEDKPDAKLPNVDWGGSLEAPGVTVEVLPNPLKTGLGAAVVDELVDRVSNERADFA